MNALACLVEPFKVEIIQLTKWFPLIIYKDQKFDWPYSYVKLHQRNPQVFYSCVICTIESNVQLTCTHIMQLTYSKNKMVSHMQIQDVKKFQYDK